MKQPAEQTLADLRSGDAQRVARALSELRARMDKAEAFDIEPFDADILTSGVELPESAQLDFVALMYRFKRFVPPLAPDRRWAALAQLVLRYGERFVAFEVSVKVKISKDPTAAIEVVMATLAAGIGSSAQGRNGPSYLVSALLDGNAQVRGATLRMLRQWPTDDAHQQVVNYVTPQLDQAEINALRGN